MIGPGAGARVMVATRPVDFRKGPDALAALVGAEYGGDPYSGVIYVFRAKRADRIKLVWWDGTGLCLMAKKLESGGFKWPGIQDGVMRLAPLLTENKAVAASGAAMPPAAFEISKKRLIALFTVSGSKTRQNGVIVLQHEIPGSVTRNP